MKNRIYIGRHADAGEAISDDLSADVARQLTDVGREQAYWVSCVLAERGEIPSLILSSPLDRCQETAAILSDVLGVCVCTAPELAHHLPLVDWLRAIFADAAFDNAMIVGHHDNLDPALAILNGIVAPSQATLDLFHLQRGEVRKVKADRDTGTWAQKWRLVPETDAMTVSVGATRA